MSRDYGKGTYLKKGDTAVAMREWVPKIGFAAALRFFEEETWP